MSPPREIQPGDLLAGKYRVERVLGSGGMGVVVAARNEQIDQRVALKSLRVEAIKDPQALARFMREARAVAKLQSVHVARVFDFGMLDGGAPYLTMELLEGKDLGARVRSSGPLPIEEAVESILQACEAIAEAHAHGIVHRDLKPANLFLTRRPDGAPFVKVLDFGIAKANPFGDDGQPITRTDAMVGTPHYMSPEQIKSARDVDARSDVWSLGVTLYELLAGHPPFPGETVGQIVSMVLQDEPRALVEQRPNVPEELAAIVERCLRKDRRQRFGDVGALSRALAPFAPPRARTSIEAIERALSTSIAPADVDELEASAALAIADTHRVGPAAAPSTKTDWGTTHAGAPTARTSSKRWPWALAASLVALLGGVGVYLRVDRGAHPSPRATTVLASSASAPPVSAPSMASATIVTAQTTVAPPSIAATPIATPTATSTSIPPRPKSPIVGKPIAVVGPASVAPSTTPSTTTTTTKPPVASSVAAPIDDGDPLESR